jgi:hypothetical protein
MVATPCKVKAFAMKKTCSFATHYPKRETDSFSDVA